MKGKRTEKLLNVFYENSICKGRMITGSKSMYRGANPGDTIYFNANILSKKLRKIAWYGDLNVTKDSYSLQRIANELGDTLYVIPEMLGRFGAEKRAYRKIKRDACAYFKPNLDVYYEREYGSGLDITKIDNTCLVTTKKLGWKEINYENI